MLGPGVDYWQGVKYHFNLGLEAKLGIPAKATLACSTPPSLNIPLPYPRVHDIAASTLTPILASNLRLKETFDLLCPQSTPGLN
jgi:hypothetical protein